MVIRRVAIPGGSGFIGSHVVDECVRNGIKVRVVDNFRTGRPEFIAKEHLDSGMVEVFQGDIRDKESLLPVFDGCDAVTHMAANADVRHGTERITWDLENNALGTLNVLQAMREVGCSQIFFASTASIYGNLQMEDGIPEDAPLSQQNSLYGASKVYGEGLCGAYAEAFGFTSIIGRWVNVVGERYLHGSVRDLLSKVLRDPERILILGDGKQRKSGIYVGDLARGIVMALLHHEKTPGHFVYNFGTDEVFTPVQTADMACRITGRYPRYEFTGQTSGGWIGDNPFMKLDTTKARTTLGWKPELTVEQAVERTINWLLSSECTYL